MTSSTKTDPEIGPETGPEKDHEARFSPYALIKQLRPKQWAKNAIVFAPLLFSGNFKAYTYLNQTIQTFPYGERFCKILKQMGFVDTTPYPLMGGAATIYVAYK